MNDTEFVQLALWILVGLTVSYLAMRAMKWISVVALVGLTVLSGRSATLTIVNESQANYNLSTLLATTNTWEDGYLIIGPGVTKWPLVPGPNGSVQWTFLPAEADSDFALRFPGGWYTWVETNVDDWVIYVKPGAVGPAVSMRRSGVDPVNGAAAGMAIGLGGVGTLALAGYFGRMLTGRMDSVT